MTKLAAGFVITFAALHAAQSDDLVTVYLTGTVTQTGGALKHGAGITILYSFDPNAGLPIVATTVSAV